MMTFGVSHCDLTVAKPWLMCENGNCIYDDEDYSEHSAWCNVNDYVPSTVMSEMTDGDVYISSFLCDCKSRWEALWSGQILSSTAPCGLIGSFIFSVKAIGRILLYVYLHKSVQQTYGWSIHYLRRPRPTCLPELMSFNRWIMQTLLRSVCMRSTSSVVHLNTIDTWWSKQEGTGGRGGCALNSGREVVLEWRESALYRSLRTHPPQKAEKYCLY